MVSRIVADRTVYPGDFIYVYLPVGTFKDPNGLSHTYEVVRLNGDPLYDWLTFYPDNRTLIGLSAPTIEGSYELQIRATNYLGKVGITSFTIIVQEDPRPAYTRSKIAVIVILVLVILSYFASKILYDVHAIDKKL